MTWLNMLFGLILFQPTTQNNNAAIPPPIFFLDENMDFKQKSQFLLWHNMFGKWMDEKTPALKSNDAFVII